MSKVIGSQQASRPRVRGHALASVSLIPFFILGIVGAKAQPVGGSVVAGQAQITTTGATTLINQSTAKAIINWQDFSVAKGAAVQFNQPSSSSLTLNRVTGTGISAINGSLTANGQVWLLNPNGLLIGNGAQINVGGLLATTSDLTNQDFLAGRYNFSGGGSGAIVNNGAIKAAPGGAVVLSAPKVVNNGIIAARAGHVVLAGTDTFTVDFDGDHLISYAVGDTRKSGTVVNTGAIKSGNVLLTAKAAQGVQDAVVNNSGMIEATSARVENGEIVLEADGGTTTDSGTLNATGKKDGETGGTVKVLGTQVAVGDGAKIDVSGQAGGGTVLIGGDFHGQGTTQQAQNTTVGHATIKADAIKSGDGGKVAVWSTGQTNFAGHISARGGAQSGNGGQVETSGHTLGVPAEAVVDTGATQGLAGNWLLDPYNLTISATNPNHAAGTTGGADSLGDGGETDVVISPNAVDTALTTGGVGLQAHNDIIVAADGAISATTSNTLEMDAAHSIILNAPISITGTGPNAIIVLNAGEPSYILAAPNGTFAATATTPALIQDNYGNTSQATLTAPDIRLFDSSATGSIGSSAAPIYVAGPSGTLSLLVAGNSALSGGTVGGASAYIYSPGTTVVALSSGTNLGTGTLSLTAASSIELTNGSAITVGGLALTSTGGTVAIDATPVNVGAGTVSLSATGNITQNAAITAGTLSASSTSGAITLTNAANAVSSFAGQAATDTLEFNNTGNLSVSYAQGAGSVQVTNAGNLTITGSGVTASSKFGTDGGSVTLSATGTITTSSSITAANGSSTAGTVSLTANDLNLGSAISAHAVNLTANTGGSISLGAGGSITGTALNFDGSGGAITLDAGGQVTVNGSVTANDGGSTTGTITLTANDADLGASGANGISGSGTLSAGNIMLAVNSGTGAIGAGGSAVALTSAGTINISATTTGGSAYLTSTGAASISSASLAGAGIFDLTAASDISVSNTLAAGSVALVSGGTISTASGPGKIVAGTVSLNTASGSGGIGSSTVPLLLEGTTSAPVNLSLTTNGGSAYVHASTAGSYVAAVAVNGVNLGGTQGDSSGGGGVAGGALVLAAGDISINGAVMTFGSSIELDSLTGSITLGAPVTSATYYTVSGPDTVVNPGLVALNANGGSISQTDAITASDLTATAAGDITLTQNNSITGSITLTSIGNVAFTNLPGIYALGEGTPPAGSAAFHIVGSAPSTLVLTSIQGDIGIDATGSLSSSGDISLAAPMGAISVGGMLAASESSAMLLSAANGISEVGTGTITAGTLTATTTSRDISLASTGNTINNTINLSAPGNITLFNAADTTQIGTITGTSVSISGVTLTQDNGGDGILASTVSLDASGSIGSSEQPLILSGGAYTPSFQSAPAVISPTSVSLSASLAGEGYFKAYSPLDVTSIQSTGGDVLSLAGLDAITVSGAISAPGEAIFLDAAGNIAVNADIVAGATDVSAPGTILLVANDSSLLGGGSDLGLGADDNGISGSGTLTAATIVLGVEKGPHGVSGGIHGADAGTPLALNSVGGTIALVVSTYGGDVILSAPNNAVSIQQIETPFGVGSGVYLSPDPSAPLGTPPGSFTLSAGGSITQNYGITAANLTLNAGGDIDLTNSGCIDCGEDYDNAVSGLIRLNAPSGYVAFGNDGTINLGASRAGAVDNNDDSDGFGEALYIRADGDGSQILIADPTPGAVVQASGPVNLYASSDVVQGSSYSAGVLDVTSAIPIQTASFTDPQTQTVYPGDLEVDSGGDVQLNHTGNAVTGTLSGYGANFNFVNNGPLAVGEVQASSYDPNTDNTVYGAVSLTTLSGDITAAPSQGFNIEGNTISLNAAGSIDSSASGENTIYADANSDAPGSVSMTAGGGISLSAIGIYGTVVTLNAGGGITESSGSIDAFASDSAPGHLSLTAGGDISLSNVNVGALVLPDSSNPQTVMPGLLDFSAAAGSVTLPSIGTDPVALHGSAGGNVTITGGSNISLYDANGNPIGTAPAITIDGPLTAGGSLQLRTNGGDIVETASGVLTVGGALDAETAFGPGNIILNNPANSISGPVTFYVVGDNNSGTGAFTLYNSVNTILGGPLDPAMGTPIGSTLAGGIITVVSAGDITINPGNILEADGVDEANPTNPGPIDSIILSAAGNFINNAGPVLNTSNGVTYNGIYTAGTNAAWKVYSHGPESDVFGGLDSQNDAVFGVTYGQSVIGPAGAPTSPTLPTGNRYVFTEQPTLTVAAAPLTKTYGQDSSAAVAADYTITASTIAAVPGAFTVAPQNYSGAPVAASAGSGAGANAGSYDITFSPGSLSASGFALVMQNGTLTINPATLLYVADAASRTYGAADPALTGAVTGFVNGDSLASATSGTLAFGSSATAASGVGSYAINGSGLSASNYVFAQAAGNATALTINPATLLYAADAASRTYGAANPALTGAVTGFVNGDTQSSATSGALAFGTSATAASGVGAYAVNGSGLSASNYVFAQAASNATALTVNPATLLYVANAASRTYGAANPALTGAITGFVNGDTQSSSVSGTLAFGTSATAASGVGSYAIMGSGLSASNYVFAQDAGNATALTINPATLLYVADAASRTYGAANPALTGTIAGFVNGDTQSSAVSGALVFGSAATAASGVGAYAVNGSGLSASNYVFQQAASNATALIINPATLLYVANAATRSAGAANPALSGRVTGFVNGDAQTSATSGTLVFTTTADPASAVGSYAVNGSGLSAVNYVFAQAASNASALTVTPATDTTPPPNTPPPAILTAVTVALQMPQNLPPKSPPPAPPPPAPPPPAPPPPAPPPQPSPLADDDSQGQEPDPPTSSDQAASSVASSLDGGASAGGSSSSVVVPGMLVSTPRPPSGTLSDATVLSGFGNAALWQ